MYNLNWLPVSPALCLVQEFSPDVYAQSYFAEIKVYFWNRSISFHGPRDEIAQLEKANNRNCFIESGLSIVELYNCYASWVLIFA